MGNGGNDSLVLSTTGVYELTGVILTDVQNITGSSGDATLKKSGAFNLSLFNVTGIEVMQG
jgi:hypothetical protein